MSQHDDPLLAEQIAYYRAVAPEYESLSLPGAGGAEAAAALEAFQPAGDILELACGPGVWTELLVRTASSVTAVDAAPEMLARAKQRVGAAQVRFVQSDLFSWRPDRRYDLVFFGFWLSHVPRERFEAFWSLISDCLTPDGRVFFVDDAYRTADELIEGEASTTIQRRLADGTAFRAIKVPYRPAELEAQLAALGWQISVTQTTGPFYWGAGHRARAPLEVTGIDHLYISVRDLPRSEAFYDPLMQLLGFRKGVRPIAGEPHAHYFNRVLQYTLRPARSGTAADPYHVGSLHHLCFQVRDREAVDEAQRALVALGIAASEPALYPEYRPDYYATFFDDPDGVRLEIVSDTAGRRLIRERWGELTDFVDPVARLLERDKQAAPRT